MGVTSTFRFKIENEELGRKWGKVASEAWKRAGATSVRASAVKKGPNVGQWIFAFDFPDLAAYEKAWKEVRASPDFKKWNEELPKVGDVVMELLDEIEL